MKADLHIHTLYSYDAISSPKEVVETALSRGINCICITDHREIRGAVEALRAGYDQDILVIPGIEIKSKAGDILGLNVKKIIPNGLSLQATAKEIRKQGGIAILAHPFAHLIKTLKRKERDLLFIDAIEVFNASIFGSFNNKAFKTAQKYNLPFTAGSDAHTPEFIGRAFIEITKNRPPATPQELLEEIRNKRMRIGGENFTLLELTKDYSKKAFRITTKKFRFRKKKIF